MDAQKNIQMVRPAGLASTLIEAIEKDPRRSPLLKEVDKSGREIDVAVRVLGILYDLPRAESSGKAVELIYLHLLPRLGIDILRVDIGEEPSDYGAIEQFGRLVKSQN